MRNLLAFLSRYQFFFLFLIFLVISLTLMYNNNYFQRSRVIGTTGKISGKLNQAYANITGFFELKRANEMLAAENARLRSEMRESAHTVADSLVQMASGPTLRFISARVISNSVQHRNNYFMLDRGWRSGIKKDMGVVTANGVVGIIIDVSENFSSGISVLHKDARISGRIKKNDQLVNVSWDGINYRLGNLEHIPAHVSLVPGDTILTSGNSQLYPEGVMIGTVDHVEDELENLFKKGKVRFSIDYNQLTYVYVVENTFREEIRQLNTGNPDE